MPNLDALYTSTLSSFQVAHDGFVQVALAVSAFLFVVGTIGVFVRRNVITVMMCIELMLNAVNLAFVAFSRAHGTIDGQILVFFVFTVAAAEAAVGLAIVIALQRNREDLDVDSFNLLKG
ncbi:MAG: NADH-quinone oxidoreductase subunit NuoK [Vicinamibacteria bacterium]|nr:NADH-quinone oxidoreductase subunit NuoK [Vicinamibacteria bacterium]